ncbi:DUF998 domain-containing protein [Fulvivirgaceae bacterium BMA12]|uniref:DUF998 domain-containing protein n=1 Tax=Agaribacillus aureus TaxID=3051825 RepID=A0ABT8LHK7_9BACT|nr:DUF998 domain-containing protein [Fulvivirgaceae bacterium BMA12]
MLKQSTFLKLISLSIILGVVGYLVLVIYLGNLKPGYSHLTDLVSELGEKGSFRGYWLNAVLMWSGSSLILFGVLLNRLLPPGRFGKWGPVFISAFGGSVLAGGLFPCDPGCIAPVSLSGHLHAILGLPAMLTVPLGFILVSFRMKESSHWHNLALFIRVSGFLTLPLMIIGSSVFPALGLMGLGQRIPLLFQLGVPLIMAVRLYKHP